MSGSIFLRRVDHGHTGADRCRAAADCDIASERGGKISDGSGGGIKRANRPGSAVDCAGERAGGAIQQAAESSASDRRRAGGKRLDRSIGNVSGSGSCGSGGQGRDGGHS